VTTFAWLVIGHLVGDWVAQNDWMAKGKRRSLMNLPGLAHFAVYTASVLGAGWLSGLQGRPLAWYVPLGAAVFLSHWLIDGTRLVNLWMRVARQSDLDTVQLMVDQTLHLLGLAVVAALV
jgi:hypothetical protein